MNKFSSTIKKSKEIQDQFSRTISYLRLSLTDRCNLRCMYCIPTDKADIDTYIKTENKLLMSELLSYEELLRIVRVAVGLGMTKLRLTGGEPLVRRGVMGFIDQLSALEGLKEIRLTTNGVLLAEKAEPLYEKGIRHLNVSLDTLQRKKFHKITGKDLFEKVWQGIHYAKKLGFKIKLNVVAMKGVNDDEFVEFGKFALTHPVQVRFIEFMPVGEKNGWREGQFVTATEIQDTLSTIGMLTSLERKGAQGPARMFSFKNSEGQKGRVGFISPISHHFCEQCNRLRLTSEGKLRSCLLHDRETNIKEILRNNCTDTELEDAIREAIMNKPQGHLLNDDPVALQKNTCQGSMSRIGG